MNYPHKCVRCGYCCLSAPCPIIRKLAPGVDICFMLTFKNEKASCGLAGIVPIGDGCCISARCFHGDEVYDFVALPKQTKRDLAQKLLSEGGQREMDRAMG